MVVPIWGWAVCLFSTVKQVKPIWTVPRNAIRQAVLPRLGFWACAQIEARNQRWTGKMLNKQAAVVSCLICGEKHLHIFNWIKPLSLGQSSLQTVQRYIAEGWLEKFYALNIQQSDHQIENLRIQARPNPTLNVGMKRSKTLIKATRYDFSNRRGYSTSISFSYCQHMRSRWSSNSKILLNQQQRGWNGKYSILPGMHQLKVYVASSMPHNSTSYFGDQSSEPLTLQEGFQAGNCPLPTFGSNHPTAESSVGSITNLRQAANCP